MALKFLNKKGWHTGSLRNIENVWKAEQKHDAEQKKLEELRKQIQEEREHTEFRLLQEQAGLVPKQERLEFLYDSGLAVGKGSSDGFKALEALPKPDNEAAASSSSAAKAAVPGALFEEKPQSANDAWRKLHSDPLLMIRQREQEALARVRNNPIQMAMIRKSVEVKKHKEKTDDDDDEKRKKHEKKSKHHRHSSSRHQHDSENVTIEDKERSGNRKSSKYDDHFNKACSDSEDEPSGRGSHRKKNNDSRERIERNYKKSKHGNYSSDSRSKSDAPRKERENRSESQAISYNSFAMPPRHESHHKRRNIAPKLSDEERAARLREMQVDAELHEDQRWKRLKKADEEDAREATQAGKSVGRNFLDAAHKSVYGAEKGGSSTIEESVRRRTHYSQRRSEADAGNAFRR